MVIAGAGPAGMATAIYASRMGWKTLVLDKSAVGGLAATTPIIENYPGFSEISGLEFADRLKAQAKKFGAEVHELVEVTDIKLGDTELTVISTSGDYKAKVVVIATGTNHRHLGVPGENEFDGKGVSYCATCDGALHKANKVIVVGGGNSAVTEALYLDNVVREVSLIHRRDRLRAEESLQNRILNNSKVNMIWDSVVTKSEGDDVSGLR